MLEKNPIELVFVQQHLKWSEEIANTRNQVLELKMSVLRILNLYVHLQNLLATN